MITGVRQCGKTFVLKEFGEKYFDNTCYINFESNSNYVGVFDFDFDVNRIINELELITKMRIISGNTLLIFDEIQECPKAITSLKYFCENLKFKASLKNIASNMIGETNTISIPLYLLWNIDYYV